VTVLEANAHFATMRGELGPNFPSTAVTAELNGEVVDCWSESMAAAARLSGMLDECTTWLHLVEAIEHFQACHSSGVFSDADWHQETVEVIKTLMEWGAEREAAA
jgi:hypothetical protein